MENLFRPADRSALLARFGALRPDAPRAWGRMDPAQMMAHCARALEAATGEAPVPRVWIGYLLGPLFRRSILGPKPTGRNAPTAAEFVVADARDFVRERERLLAVAGRFADAGPAAAAGRKHAFLGTLTGEEWGRLMWKHLDHHLRQFGT